jgi:Protein of unknown function (DUF5818)
VKKRIQSLSFLAILGVAVGIISWGSTLHAQQAPSTPSDSQQAPAQTPDTQQPAAPDTPPAAQQRPSTESSPSNTDSQTFSGTVMKQGDKYVLKDDSGKTYDIDHQTDVAKFEGKRVRVQGTLDASGTKILVR